MRPSLGLCGLCALLVVISGACQEKAQKPAQRVDARFTPTRVQIHPLSHVIRRGPDDIHIEAVVQVLDADGLPVRSGGMLEVSFQQSDDAGHAVMKRLSWTRDLDDPAVNLGTFDPATRAYVLIASLQADEVPRFPHVSAMLRSRESGVLTDSARVPVLESTSGAEVVDQPTSP